MVFIGVKGTRNERRVREAKRKERKRDSDGTEGRKGCMTSRKLKLGKSEELRKKKSVIEMSFHVFFVLFCFVGFFFVCLFPHIYHYTIIFSISKNLIFPVC